MNRSLYLNERCSNIIWIKLTYQKFIKFFSLSVFIEKFYMLIKFSNILNTSNIFKTFAKNSFLIAFGTIIGFVNVSLASKKLGLIEYGNYLNFYILAQVILGFSILGFLISLE